MIRWLAGPLPALIAALIAIFLAVLYLDRGFDAGLVVVAAAAAIIVLAYACARLAFRRWPYYAGFVMETGFLLLILGSGIAGAVLIWLAIDKAPGEGATAREKEVWAAMSAAVTAYLGSIIIKPERAPWNPVKSAIKTVFGAKFKERATDLERDARDAVQQEAYGAAAPSHRGQVVEGWGWDARRLRTRHIQDA